MTKKGKKILKWTLFMIFFSLGLIDKRFDFSIYIICGSQAK